MSDSHVNLESLLLNLTGFKRSGAMKRNVPKSPISGDEGSSESREKETKSKSARQALGGVSFVTRILACLVSGKIVSLKQWDTNPFGISVHKTVVV